MPETLFNQHLRARLVLATISIMILLDLFKGLLPGLRNIAPDPLRAISLFIPLFNLTVFHFFLLMPPSVKIIIQRLLL